MSTGEDENLETSAIADEDFSSAVAVEPPKSQTGSGRSDQ